MEFLQGNRPFMFIAGRQKDITSLLDMPFAGNLFSNNGTNKAVRIGIGSTKTSVSNITVSSFGQSLFNFTVPSNVNLYRRVLVTTFSNQVRMGEKGIVSVDLSRSATHYQQEAAATDSTLRDRSSLSKILSANNLLDNTAVSIVYSDELGAEGLSYQFSFNKVSNGYVNPGNAFLSNGSTELGLNLRKMFLKNKIQVTLRGKGRQYSYDVNGNRKWKNIFAMLDARWKMKKGQYLSVRYQPTRMIRIEQSSKQVVSINDRLSVDANLYKRWHRITYRNQVTLSYQKSSYDFNRSSLSTSSFMVNSFQNISLGKNLLFTNISYNKAANSSGFIYLNSSFIAETGFTYQLFNKLSASSGLTYNSIAGWYKQLGIRQSLSGQLGEKFSMNIYIDAGKTLSLLQPLWNEPVRADISIRYILGNNN